MIDAQTPDERLLRERTSTLLDCAEAETDTELQAALLEQCFRLQRRAIGLQLARKQSTLKELGIPLQAP